MKTYIKYGLEDQLTFTTAQTGSGNEHEVSLNQETLIPGTRYSYIVIAEDAQGKITESQIYSLKTKGYKVVVTVLGKDNKPLTKKKVTLHSEPMQVETDSKGTATFADVAPGAHELEYTDGDKKFTQSINVEDSVPAEDDSDSATASPQNFSVIFSSASTSSLPMAAIMGITVLVLAFVAFMIIKRTGRFSPGTVPVSSFAQPGLPPAAMPPAANSSTDDLLRSVPGLHQSDPGTVISPNENKEKKG